MSLDDLYVQSRRAALLSALCGLTLGAVKLAAGLLGHSFALASDAFHSLGDALTAGVVLLALRWSQMPPDREHPYGHTRAEAVAGSNVALILCVAALGIIWKAVESLVEGRTELASEPSLLILGIAGANVLIKEALYRLSSRIAERSGSSSIRATAWDHRLDALSALAVLAAIGLIRWRGPAFGPADDIAGIIVAMAMLWAGGQLFWTSLQELVDRQADPAMLDRVRREALAVPDVRNVEKILARKSGLEYLVDIHIEVDPNISVRAGHDIAHRVKNRLIEEIVPVKDVLVHIEPAADTNSQLAGRPA